MADTRPFALALLLMLPFLAACAANKPQVAVGRAAWIEQTEEAAILHIDLEVTNRGRAPLELRELRYLVTQGGRTVYHGRRSTARTIAPGDRARLTVPAVVRTENLATVATAGEVSFAGSMGFVTPGRLALVMRDLGLPPLRRDFVGEAPITPAAN